MKHQLKSFKTLERNACFIVTRSKVLVHGVGLEVCAAGMAGTTLAMVAMVHLGEFRCMNVYLKKVFYVGHYLIVYTCKNVRIWVSIYSHM